MFFFKLVVLPVGKCPSDMGSLHAPLSNEPRLGAVLLIIKINIAFSTPCLE